MKGYIKLLLIIMVLLIMPTVNAKSMKATDYIQKIADDAGGNKNSIEPIGNTGLAYDGTDDNNLRYIGQNPRNFISFNDQLWRVIGIMNNVKDSEGNKTPRLKLIGYANTGSAQYYDVRNTSINLVTRPSDNYLNGAGVNEWSESILYKTLNPGYDNNIDSDYSNNQKVNNSLYWNRQNGKCLQYSRKRNYGSNTYTNSLATYDCDFSQTGMKDEYKKYISNISWNTGTVPLDFSDKKAREIYSYERGEARKCTSNETTCNDNIQRKSSTIGRVGLIYPSDVLYAITTNNGNNRSTCLNQSINTIGATNNQYNCTLNSSWLNNIITMTPVYDPDYGNKVVDNYLAAGYTSNSTYNINPVIYLEPSTRIVGGTGDYGSPYIIADANYQEINNDSNKKVTTKYKGNYSIDYLINNYNIVTFGTKDNTLPGEYKNNVNKTKKGDVKNLVQVEGPVLINNDFTTNSEMGLFSVKSNKDESFIKGELGSNMITPSKVVTNKDYVDFEKMYAQVVNEQQMLVDKTEHNINKEKIEINTPGIYMINNTMPITAYINQYDNNEAYYYYNEFTNYNYSGYIYARNIYIDNYDPNKNYVFNIMNEFDIDNYVVLVKSNGAPAFTKIDDLINEGNYTGNVIFNYPNARYIELKTISGTIIAPKADIYISQLFINTYNATTMLENNNIIIANSVTGTNNKIKYIPHNTKKILSEEGKQYVVEPKDYNDDLYTYDYSLNSLLENYNVVTLGKHNYQNNTKFKNLNYKKGSTAIFHIDGQFLVNGDLGTTEENYPGYTTNGYNNTIYNNFMRFDLDSNLITESCLKGDFKTEFYIKNWKTNTTLFGSKNNLYSKSGINYQGYWSYYNGNYQSGAISDSKDFINFDRLYDNIVEQQKAIKPGQDVKGQNGKAHIKVGSNYVIDNINDVNEIIFDDFANNKNKLTIITIKDSGNINFPKMSADTIGLIETNDYYGKKEATHLYEMDRELIDYYHGNIIWNIPNANYIKLAANAPFAGHIIAPKADVESPETQIAGAIIANSFYAEGASEAHFYPITTTKIDEYYVDKNGKIKTRVMDLGTLLRSETSIINYDVIGDYQAYLKDNKNKSNSIIRDIFTNPKTSRGFGIILLLLVISFISHKIYQKNKEITE